MSVRDDGPPALIIEVASATTWRYDVDRDDGKPAGYLHLGVPEYLVFDPTGTYWGAPCRGWRREGETMQEWRPTSDGRYHCTSLGISFGPDEDLLRVFDPEGRPVAYIHEKSQEIAERDRRLAELEEELRRLRGV
jgi:Uma2 family endonuclease